MSAARRTGAHALVLATVVAMLLIAGKAPAEPASTDRTLSPYFVVSGGDPSVDRLPLRSTHVTVEVAGVIAEVRVRQTYENRGLRPLHARYVFPASTRAAVHGLTMTVGDERVVARIREREKARKEFVAAQKAGKNAALLEEQRPNVFSMDVANVMPGQAIDVELEYSELLVPTAGEYEFVFPTVVGPRYSSQPAQHVASHDRFVASAYTHQGEPPAATFALEGTLAGGVPVHGLASPTHAIVTDGDDSTRVRFALAASESLGANRDFVLHYRLTGGTLASGLILHRGAHENFFLATVQPPRRVSQDEIPPREYVFVVDVSGSMQGFPLETSKTLLRDLLSRLRPDDRFNVLLFAGDSRLLAPASLPATPENLARAIAVLDAEPGGGGTELGAALRRALALPASDSHARSILIVTDGYIEAERDVFDLVRHSLGRSNVFAFGIGSSVNRYLIEGLARAGQGEPFITMEPAAAEATAKRFREYVQSPLLTHVGVAFEGFEAYDVEPEVIPDVLAERPVLVFGKWRGDAKGRVVITGTSGQGAFREVLTMPATPATNPALRSLWARTRLAQLSDLNSVREEDATRRDIVALGLEYQLLTRYTSFIAVHERIVNASGAADDVAQPLPLPKGVEDSAVGGMGQGDEPGLAWLLAAMLAVALLLWLARQSTAAVRVRL